MYKHYETSEDVFVDREEQIEWMSKALERCKKGGVVLHLKGIGGIGKSSLLNHWVKTHENTVRLDCEQYSEFYQRLSILAKGAVLQGVRLQRFDILWQIRQRFVEGVEPVREEGREWAKEVVMAIPFIGSLASIGSAIHAVGTKVTPKLKGKYSKAGKWLQESLGKDYVEQLLQILWKDPRRAEFLYLDAFLEDVNRRISINTPMIFLFDHFECVDESKAHWKYSGQKLNEAQVWTMFLCCLSNCVGVLASRRAAGPRILEIEESELTELDEDSCIEMLELQGVLDKRLQERIVSISGGNPFLIDIICDLLRIDDASIEDVDGLEASTLDEVRIKAWRRLFNEAHDLTPIIDRAGLLAFFDRPVMNIVAPDMKAEQWDRLTRLSFVRKRDDGTYVLHDLARSLVITELGDMIPKLVKEVAGHLHRAYEERSDASLLGHAISAVFLSDEEEAIQQLLQELYALADQARMNEMPALLGSLRTDSVAGSIVFHYSCGYMHHIMNRTSEAEDEYKSALAAAREFARDNSQEGGAYVMLILGALGSQLTDIGRYEEAEEVLEEGYRISRESRIGPSPDAFNEWVKLQIHSGYGFLKLCRYRLLEAEEALRTALREAVEFDRIRTLQEDTPARNEIRQQRMSSVGILRGRLALTLMMLGNTREAETFWRENLGMSPSIITSSLSPSINLGMSPSIIGGSRIGLAEVLRVTNRPLEAEGYYRQSVEATKEEIRRDPEVPYPPTFTLTNLASSLVLLREYDKAAELYQESLEAVSKFAEETPEVWQPFLLWTLSDYAVLQRMVGMCAEAEKLNSEALRLSRRLEKSRDPKVLKLWTGLLLNNRGVILRCIGLFDEAEECYREAIGGLCEEARDHPEAVTISDFYSALLNNIGVLLRKSNRLAAAEEYLTESCKLKRHLADVNPEMFAHGLSIALGNLGVLLAESNRFTEAEGFMKESVSIGRALVEEAPDLYLPSLAASLNNLAVLQKRTGRLSESWKALQEASDILDDYRSRAPQVYRHHLAALLSNIALLASEDEKLRKESRIILERLSELRVGESADTESWVEEEQEILNPIGPFF